MFCAQILKMPCTIQYAWVSADSTVGDEPGFQRMECQVIAGAGEEGLPAQFSEEFHGGSLQVASPATLL